MIEFKLSNSEMQSYKDCPRKWYLNYYRELAPKHESTVGPLGLGTKIHLVLEHLYSPGETDPLGLLGDLYDADEETLEEHPFKDEMLKELHKEHDLAHAMVTGFIQWREEEGIDADYELIALEQVIEAQLEEYPGVTLRGKLDQRLRRISDGAILFNDWKTTKTFTDRWLLQLNEQMKFYLLLEYLTSETGTFSDGALYTMIRKVKRTAAAKPPFFMREVVRHNAAELQSFYLQVTEIVEKLIDIRTRLDAGEPMQKVVPPRPSRDCTWKCKFNSICPMFDDGSRVEDAIAEHYVHQDPHERYNKEDSKGDGDE